MTIDPTNKVKCPLQSALAQIRTYPERPPATTGAVCSISAAAFILCAALGMTFKAVSNLIDGARDPRRLRNISYFGKTVENETCLRCASLVGLAAAFALIQGVRNLESILAEPSAKATALHALKSLISIKHYFPREKSNVQNARDAEIAFVKFLSLRHILERAALQSATSQHPFFRRFALYRDSDKTFTAAEINRLILEYFSWHDKLSENLKTQAN